MEIAENVFETFVWPFIVRLNNIDLNNILHSIVSLWGLGIGDWVGDRKGGGGLDRNTMFNVQEHLFLNDFLDICCHCAKFYFIHTFSFLCPFAVVSKSPTQNGFLSNFYCFSSLIGYVL